MSEVVSGSSTFCVLRVATLALVEALTRLATWCVREVTAAGFLFEFLLATWFGEQGYVIKTEGEKVLREIATPVTFTSKNKEVAAKRLYSALKEDDAYLLSIANIQQVMATDSSYDPYVYTVTYYAVPNETYSSNENNSAAICKRASVRMAYSKTAGVSVLDIVSSGSGTNGEYCLAAYNSMSVKAQYTNDTSTVNMDNTEELTVDGANDTTATFTPETTTETETNE